MFLSSRIVSLIGAFGVFVSSLMTWFWSEGQFRRTENAWQGEESLAAVIVMLVAVTILAVGWSWRGGWIAMGIIELLLGLACFGLTAFFILYNREPVIVSGVKYPTGIGSGAWVALFSSVVMVVGSILYLCSGGPAVFFGEEEFLDEADFEFEADEFPSRPRRRRRPPRPRRLPPRRRSSDV